MKTRGSAEPGEVEVKNQDTRAGGPFANGHWKASTSPPREFPPATPLFVQGNEAQEVFRIERGLVKLSHLDEDGQELIVGLRSKGQWLGTASAIVQESHPVTAITVSNCSLSIIPSEIFLQLAKADAQFC